jgi:hypothetical protein
MLENSEGTMENPENHKDYTHFYFCILEKKLNTSLLFKDYIIYLQEYAEEQQPRISIRMIVDLTLQGVKMCVRGMAVLELVHAKIICFVLVLAAIAFLKLIVVLLWETDVEPLVGKMDVTAQLRVVLVIVCAAVMGAEQEVYNKLCFHWLILF